MPEFDIPTVDIKVKEEVKKEEVKKKEVKIDCICNGSRHPVCPTHY